MFREGDYGHDFIVILAGRVAIVDHQAGTERELETRGPGEFVAELNLLTGERLFTTAVVSEPGTVMAVPVARLQAVIGRDQGLGQWIIRTMFARRQWLAQQFASAHDCDRRLAGRYVVVGQDAACGRIGIGIQPDVREPVARGELQQAASLRRGP